MKILLTGATGFIGSRLATALYSSPDAILTITLRRPVELDAAQVFEVKGLDVNADWSSTLANQQVVIHAAGLAHRVKDAVADPLVEYRKVNVDGTLNLARQAAVAGVKRFIFLSSISVNGNNNTNPLTENDVLNPSDPNACSKAEAEQGLWEIHHETGMELVIIRPPLVYGPNAPGNFGSLIRWVETGIPLPLGAIKNQRSLVAIDNLVDLIITSIDHPSAANQVFLASDGHDLSTTELLQGIAAAMGKTPRLIPVPKSWLMFGAALLGKHAAAQRLLGSLQVDISKAQDLLGWEPPISVQEGLRRCCLPKSK